MEIPFSEALLNYGVLGILTAILLWVVYTLFKMLMAEKEKRLEEAKAITTEIMGPIKQLQQTGETQITLLRQVLEKAKGQ